MENIKKRISIRTFEKKELSKDHMDKLKNFIKDIEEKHSGYRFPIINSHLDGKVGTYGVITDANTYICGVVEDDNHDLVKLGYLFEQIILFASSLDLGTCWLGGTFKRSEFAEKANLAQGESFICASPVGYIADKRSLKESAMRKIAKSDQRLDFNELFFQKDLTPLNKEELDIYGQALEMVRIGPSASNKQPWRMVKDNESYHLYLERTPDYAKNLGYDIQLLDMGIAQCHFETSLKEMGKLGSWKKLSEHPKYKDFEYISTWIE